MPSYVAPIQDYRFLLHHVIKMQDHTDLPPYQEATPDLIDAILEEAGKISTELLHPLNQSGDAQGCRLDGDQVLTPDGFKDAYRTYCQGGWLSLVGNPEYGGQGLPRILGLAVDELAVSANWGLAMYAGLTNGAAAAIDVWGTDIQKQAYLPRMLSGDWAGTMNLTEPHCGTDLGLIRTKAEPAEDGSYRLTGTKIFISAGDHDLTENIIHLVLARVPGGPEGVKGISLFIVPKILIKDDGTLGERNAVSCGALEHKMGIHSNATCVMNYDGATGYLLGDLHEGMRAMFTMMNEARLGVAVQGLAIAEIAQQNAATYARDRLQGRALTGPKAPDKAADPIIVHPDVRRNLMLNRAFIEGARALVMWTGLQVDLSHSHPDEDRRKGALDFVALLTPVLKSYLTDEGFQATSRALQCFGGHGYIREWGMEQFMRDARIAPIYEGTNGIQAMDLIGRKLPADNGRAIRAYFALIQQAIDDIPEDDRLKNYAASLEQAKEALQKASLWLMEHAMKNPDHAGGAAQNYLNLMALNALGHMWLLMAKEAYSHLQLNDGDADFMHNKLKTADFFFAHILPDSQAYLAKITAGADSIMALEAEAF
ncbi:MAG: acyl-CoA dehydrogenase [Kordiimonas sp.]|nr:acyl-CoA dehydrogenase [Kordiimonas sp.]|tara:strand:- start:1120 stop:2910 length:1791 start_codon:yes stop_codon:yes gene_type:complete